MANPKQLLKQCKTCLVEKPREAFTIYLTGPKAGQLASADCKACKAKHQALKRGVTDYQPRGYYTLSDEERQNQKVKYRKQKAGRLREYLASVLKGAKCHDCPETDWRIFHFDHREPALKSFEIGTIVAKGSVSLDRLKAEVDKCDIVCPSCHAKRTVAMFGAGWREG